MGFIVRSFGSWRGSLLSRTAGVGGAAQRNFHMERCRVTLMGFHCAESANESFDSKQLESAVSRGIFSQTRHITNIIETLDVMR